MVCGPVEGNDDIATPSCVLVAPWTPFPQDGSIRVLSAKSVYIQEGEPTVGVVEIAEGHLDCDQHLRETLVQTPNLGNLCSLSTLEGECAGEESAVPLGIKDILGR